MVVVVDEASGDKATVALEQQLQVTVPLVSLQWKKVQFGNSTIIIKFYLLFWCLTLHNKISIKHFK